MQIKELVESRELLTNLTLRELRGKYKRSALGWGWSLLNPLMNMVIYTVVFKFFLKVTPEPGKPSGLNVFALLLLAGLLPWNFFNTTVNNAMGTLIGNAGLVKKVAFVRETLVLATVGAGLLTFAVEMSVFAVVLLFFGNMVLPWLIPTIVLMLILAVFATGLGLVMASVNVYFRDLQYLWLLLSQALFFASPITYPISIPRKYLHGVTLWFYEHNPMTVFIEAFRRLLYDLRWPTVSQVSYLLVISVAMLLFGFWVFGKLDHRLAEEL